MPPMPPVLPSLGALIGGSGLVSLGLIPLFVMGLTFFRYSAVDPESRPIDTKQVRSTPRHIYCVQSFHDPKAILIAA